MKTWDKFILLAYIGLKTMKWKLSQFWKLCQIIYLLTCHTHCWHKHIVFLASLTELKQWAHASSRWKFLPQTDPALSRSIINEYGTMLWVTLKQVKKICVLASMSLKNAWLSFCKIHSCPRQYHGWSAQSVINKPLSTA